VSKIYIGDVGIKVKVETGIDLTDATTCVIKVAKPNGQLKEWAAVRESPYTSGILSYVTIGIDLDVAGTYLGMAYIETSGGGKYFGESFSFQVWEKFK